MALGAERIAREPAPEVRYRSGPITGAAVGVFALALTLGVLGAGELAAGLRIVLVAAAAVLTFGILVRGRWLRRESAHEAALARANAELKAKDELLAGVSHEIQDPLTSLYGLSELLLKADQYSPFEIAEFIDLMHHDAANLALLAEDLYVVSRSSFDADSKDARIDLLLESERLAEWLEASGRSVKVLGEPVVTIGAVRPVRHVLRSIMANIERFGGTDVEINVQSRAGLASVIIADNGPPLDTDPSIDTEEDAGSRTGRSGVRLSIARMMAESIGANLTYERQLGWTNFIFQISDDRRGRSG